MQHARDDGTEAGSTGVTVFEFSLEDHVPQDHLLRSIDSFFDVSGIRGHWADFYSHTGRPSVDPELLIRMLLVGYPRAGPCALAGRSGVGVQFC